MTNFYATSDWVLVCKFRDGKLTRDVSPAGENHLINSGAVYNNGADFEKSEYDFMYRADADLSANFPGKTGYCDLTVWCEFTPESFPTNLAQTFCGKAEFGHEQSWSLDYINTADVNHDIRIVHTGSGPDGNGDNYAVTSLYANAVNFMTAGVRYGFGLSITNSTRAFFFKLYNLDTDTVVAETTGTLSYDIEAKAGRFTVGCLGYIPYGNEINHFDGIIHDLDISNTPKVEADFDAMAAGTYGSESAAVLVKLNANVVYGLYYLIRITAPDGTVYYFGERSLTYNAHAYLPSILDISSLPQGDSSKDTVTITFSNVDGYFTTLDRTKSLLGSKVEVLEYLEDVEGAILKWSGWADDFGDLTDGEATLNVFSGFSSLKTEAPRRVLSPNCQWAFGVFNYGVGANPVIDFDGCECPYQYSAGKGFYTVTAAAINDSDDPATFNITPLSDGELFAVDDEIKIDNEILRVYSVASASNITCTRAVAGTVIAAHSSGATIKFTNCHYTVKACKRRGMFGNNAADTYYDDEANLVMHNYYGGVPLIYGPTIPSFKEYIGYLFFKTPITTWKSKFAGNEGIYGSELALVYGRCLISNPLLLIAKVDGQAPNDNNFVSYLFAVCEGCLATNSTDGSQTTPLNAYETAVDSYEAIYVNGKRRHDMRPGVGIWLTNGMSPQSAPPMNGISYFTGDYLGFDGTAIVKLTITEENNANSGGADSLSSASASMHIKYGRLVRVYSTPTVWTFKASTGPADMLLDFETSRRSGGGQAYSHFNIQSFLDLNTHCNETVTSTVSGISVKRWTFNGAISGKRAFDEHERTLCLSFYCIPPFLDENGLLTVKPLKSETLTGLPIFTSTSGTSRNIIVEENGKSSLIKRRRSLLEVPNEVKVNFMDYDAIKKSWLKTQLILTDREAQTRIGNVANDGSRRNLSKTVDLPGVTTTDEAARIGTLILRAGEFAEGGTANNLIIEFDSLYKDASSVKRGDIIQVEDAKLDVSSEQFFRVIKITDNPEQVENGGIVFKRHIVATFHSNSIYDDTAYTCTEVTRLVGIGAYDAEPPAVTNFTITEECVYNKFGEPQSKLTFLYTEPGEYAGYINHTGGYAIGVTEIALDGISTITEILMDDILRIGTKEYSISETIEVVTGACTITLKSGLLVAVNDDDVVSVLRLEERDSFRNVVIQRSTTDGDLSPVGDWRFVAELDRSGTYITYDITNEFECFTALSKNKAGLVPSPETKGAAGTYKYPRQTILIDGSTDGANPSGASNLTILTPADDSKIPPYHVVFQLNKDTSNADSLMGLAAYLSNEATAEGPFDVERTAHADCVIEEGVCDVVAGQEIIQCRISGSSRPSNTDVLQRLMLVFTDDASPDSDLDGEIIKAQAVGSVTTQGTFIKSGTFNYSVVKRFWDIGRDTTNVLYKWFTIKELEGGVQDVWRTPPIALPAGQFYVTTCTRNTFGLGSRLTAGPVTIAYEGTVTIDTDNPSGCSSLVILTHADDATVPAYDATVPEECVAFRFNRDTLNWQSIFIVEITFSTGENAHGPYASQRTAYPDDVLATGYTADIIAGNPIIPVTISTPAPPNLNGKVLLIHKTGDDKLTGDVIKTHGASTIEVYTGFPLSGNYNIEVVEPWWNLNPWHHTFYVPEDMANFDRNQTVWQTKPVPLFPGTYYAHAWTRNLFGMSDA
jgi:hypothetical protein